MIITKADKSDLKQILDLQYLAYQSEARLINDFTIPPLKQTSEEIEQEYQNSLFLKAVNEKGEIIGSVRGCVDNNKTAFIGKLIVHPEKQGQGIGTKLLKTMETILSKGKNTCIKKDGNIGQKYSVTRYELFTSNKSIRNISLYERLGYVRFREQKVSGNLTLVYMEKYTTD
jgi:ribosomal protein S18 acetylase RimI-like enzyme